MYCATNFLVRIFVKNLDMFLNGFGICFRYCEYNYFITVSFYMNMSTFLFLRGRWRLEGAEG
jgi:hypothetical protein